MDKRLDCVGFFLFLCLDYRFFGCHFCVNEYAVHSANVRLVVGVVQFMGATSKPYALYEALAGKLLGRCQGMASGHKFRFKNPLYSLGASTIDLVSNFQRSFILKRIYQS